MQIMRSQLDIESYGISDIGLTRGNNEDVWAELPSYHFYVLADGIGGHQAGEIAAKEAVLELCDAIDGFFSKNTTPSVESASKVIRDGISAANSWVRRLAKNHSELSGMGTTLCCLLLLGETLLYTHLGDSRIYKFHGELERLTDDHSTLQKVVSRKDFDATGKPLVKFKNVITKAIGIADILNTEIKTLPVQKGDIFLMCSDGLTNCVKDPDIEQILKSVPSIKQAAIQLVEKAKIGGGNDNITIVIIKIS